MHQRGFTLIELLVVIAIISVLAGMTLAGISIAGKTKARNRTTALMGQVQADLVSYRTLNGSYPEGPVATSPNAALKAQDWDNEFGTGTSVKKVADLQDPQWATIAGFLITHLTTMGGAQKDYQGLQDGWKGTIRYRPAKYYPFTPSAGGTPTGPAIDSDDPPGKDSYQLWSMGPDKTDQYGVSGSDDVTSWTK